MRMEQSPVIKSDKAAKRLKYLLSHGIDPPTRLVDSLKAPLPSPQLTPTVTLPISILDHPIIVKDQAKDDFLSTTLGELRDLQAEIGVDQNTLEALRLPSGALVRVSNTNRPDIRSRLARVWLYSDDDDKSDPKNVNKLKDAAACLSPSLSYNLGFAPHLDSLLSSSLHGNNDNNNDENDAGNNNRVTISLYTTSSIDVSTSTTSDSSSIHIDPETNDSSDDSTGNQPKDEDTGEYANLPQPSPLQPVKIPVAREIHVSVVREPRTGWTPPKSDSNHQNSISDMLDNTPSEDPVKLIEKYFGGSYKVVSHGDIIAVAKKTNDSSDGDKTKNTANTLSSSLLSHLLSNLSIQIEGNNNKNDDDGRKIDYEQEQPRRWNFKNFVFLRVSKVIPEDRAIQAVDVSITKVRLSGTCSCLLPVGIRGYLSDLPPPRCLLGWHPHAASLKSGWNLPFVGELLPYWKQIANVLAPLLHPESMSLPISLRIAVLVHGPPGSGLKTAVTAASAALGCHLTAISCHDIRGDGMIPDSKIAEGLRVSFDIAGRYRPCILLLEDIHTLAPVGDAAAEAAASRLGNVLAECIQAGLDKRHAVFQPQIFPCPVILIGSAISLDDIAPPIRRCFTHDICIYAPDVGQRETLLRSFMRHAGDDLDPDGWRDMARHTAGLLPRDLKSFAADACASAALNAIEPLNATFPILSDNNMSVKDVDATNSRCTGIHRIIKAPPIDGQCIHTALSKARDRMATDIGAPKIPNVKWDDVGGLEDVKLAILDTVELPLKHPELFSGGLRRRSGVLLYGPPGTGKTLLAKAVATECAVNFLSVKGPELINMYVGESERQIREVFAKARRAKPCVVFFDELDSLAPARGKGSDSGGVMDRVVSQLLAEIDSAQGGSGTDDVFIIGATNRPDLLDPALLRPGRLDKLLYVGVASDTASQIKVITALTHKFDMHEDVDLEEVAAACPPRLTGADLYALCADAWMNALKRQTNDEELRENTHVMVRNVDFKKALIGLRPSLHEEDIQRYEQIRDQYIGK